MRSMMQPKKCILLLIGSAVLAFGLYNIHAFSDITEGGILGLTLLLEHWFSISPALSGFILSCICYLIGWKTLGKPFLLYSFIAAAGFSVAYWICEQYPPLWPEIANFPLLASILGACFVGVGTGICVRSGGAPSGDDALAMSVSHVSPLKLQHAYFISDALVLGLSLTYIPFQKIGYSLLSVILSGQLAGLIQQFHWEKKKT